MSVLSRSHKGESSDGCLKSVARHYVSSIAYAAQGSRPDLCVAVSQLESLVDQCSLADDKSLIRLMHFIHSRVHIALVGIISTADIHIASSISRHGFKTRYGGISYALGRRTLSPWKWGSWVTLCLSTSTLEAEPHGLLRLTRDCLEGNDYLCLSLRQQVNGINMRADNTPLIAAVKKGGITSSTLRSEASPCTSSPSHSYHQVQVWDDSFL